MAQYQVTFEIPDGTGEVTVWEGEADDWKHAIDLAEEEHDGLTRVDVLLIPKHPEVEIESRHLAAYSISATRSAMRIAQVSKEEISEFTHEALETESDEEVLDIIRKWVTVK